MVLLVIDARIDVTEIWLSIVKRFSFAFDPQEVSKESNANHNGTFGCVIFIEFIRGVPLITLLFFGMVMLPLFLPEGITLDGLVRCLIAVTLFQGAYMAEVIRGGLQAIPQGQYEAAQSVGLSYWQMNRKIILPQSIRITIPSIVNTSIGLFKDTTLVLIVGQLDLLGIGRAVLAAQTWMGLSIEVYVFVAVVFIIFTFSMSRYSLYLEKKLKTGINMGAD